MLQEITVRDKQVKVDIEGELREFDWGQRVRWQEDKLVAVSPFRHDTHPSFFVNLTGEYAGTWKDSGSEFSGWEKGNFVKLLSFMRNESYEETEEYLAYTYGFEIGYGNITLDLPNLSMDVLRNALPAEFLTPYQYRHSYLGARGITENVQRIMKIGFCKQTNAVVIPWINQRGEIANCKFRTVKGKIFWYTKNALPIKHQVYGINAIYGRNAKRAVICEAEIDALTWMSWGVPAIAVGGVNFDDVQADIIKRSPIETLVIGADNDTQGEKLKASIVDKLGCYMNLEEVVYPNSFKDANEIKVLGLEAPQTQALQAIKVTNLKLF